MVSEMAMEDVDSLAKKGINLTPREIIKLNALGCRCEKHPNASSYYALPRCAFLGEGENQIVFQEPNIGQQLWLENVLRVYDENDDTTIFFLKAFSMSRDVLPDWKDIRKVQKELKRFVLEVVNNYTIRQVISCVDYCLYGCNANDHEFPPQIEEEDKTDIELGDEIQSTVIGVLHDSQAMGLGISIEDAKKMTKSEMQAVIQGAYEEKGVDISKEMKNRAINDYYRAFEAIKKSHEANDGNNKSGV